MARTYRQNSKYLSQWQRAKGKKQLVSIGKIKPYACDDVSNSAYCNEKLRSRRTKLEDGSYDYFYHSKFLGNFKSYDEFLKEFGHKFI